MCITRLYDSPGSVNTTARLMYQSVYQSVLLCQWTLKGHSHGQLDWSVILSSVQTVWVCAGETALNKSLCLIAAQPGFQKCSDEQSDQEGWVLSY